MIIYKKKQFALNYCPNFEFGSKQLSSSLGQRKKVMTTILPYNHEAYLEFNVYSKNPLSQLFRNPTVPNFISCQKGNEMDYHQYLALFKNIPILVWELIIQIIKCQNSIILEMVNSKLSQLVLCHQKQKKQNLYESSEEIEQFDDEQ